MKANKVQAIAEDDGFQEAAMARNLDTPPIFRDNKGETRSVDLLRAFPVPGAGNVLARNPRNARRLTKKLAAKAKR